MQVDAYGVIGATRYDALMVVTNPDSKIRKAYMDHLFGIPWHRHKQAAARIFSRHYDSAAGENSDILLDKVEETAMEDFISSFKREFGGVAEECLEFNV